MLYTAPILAALCLLFSTAHATPVVLETRQNSITVLTTAEVSSFKPFTFYASAAYCQPATTLTWSCGATCNANPTFLPVASGGDGDLTQFWFVGFDPDLDSVIVSHQGTDTSKIFALATDLNFLPGTLNPKLFPGVSSNVKVHSGFMIEQAMTATAILNAVRTAISTHGATKVTVVGHSLGAALALLDGVFLSLQLPSTSVSVVGYGMPRVGNQAWATFVDGLALSVKRINNKLDPIPTVPGRSFGYHHPSGERHIIPSNDWVLCPGQDNTSTKCSTGAVPNVFVGTESDHTGPYDGIIMGC